MDESSLSCEDILRNKKRVEDLSRDFRIETTQLYLKVAKNKFDFQKERFDKLMRDFPTDRYDRPLEQQQAVTDNNQRSSVGFADPLLLHSCQITLN